MKNILTEAVALANATSRTPSMAPGAADWYYYPGSGWVNQLLVRGYEFETPIPEITREGVKSFPPTGYRLLNSRTSFFSGVTGNHAWDGHARARHWLAIPVDNSEMRTSSRLTAPRPTR